MSGSNELGDFLPMAKVWGQEIGDSYERIWNDNSTRSSDLEATCRQVVIAQTDFKVFGSVLLPISATVCSFIIAFLLGAVNVFLGVLSFIPSFVVLLVLVTKYLTGKHRAMEHKVDVLTRTAFETAQQRVESRRRAAKAHSPEKAATGTKFQPEGPMPTPQPFGVSHQGAEELCAQWMRFFGEKDARTTRFVADGGIDIESLHYVAQVKNYTGTVGVAAIRELVGVAAADGRKAMFFTSGTYAAGAIEFAEKSEMPLFRYNAEKGTLDGENHRAKRLLDVGF